MSLFSCGKICNKTAHCLLIQQRAPQQNHSIIIADKPNKLCHDWPVPFFCMSIWHKTYTISTSSTEKNFQCFYLPILWTTQSCWQRGQRLFCFTHKDMQQLWKEWLHSPQTTTQSSCLFSAWHLRQAFLADEANFIALARSLFAIWKQARNICKTRLHEGLLSP